MSKRIIANVRSVFKNYVVISKSRVHIKAADGTLDGNFRGHDLASMLTLGDVLMDGDEVTIYIDDIPTVWRPYIMTIPWGVNGNSAKHIQVLVRDNSRDVVAPEITTGLILYLCPGGLDEELIEGVDAIQLSLPGVLV